MRKDLGRRSVLAAATLLFAPPARAQDAPDDGARLQVLSVQSRHLGQARRVVVYLPKGRVAGQPLPVIYMADGQSAATVIKVLDGLIAEGRVRPVMLVGLYSAGDGESRHKEYLPGFQGGSEAPFNRHRLFLVEEVMPMAEARYGASTDPGERMLLGFSDGACWSIATALRSPKLFSRAAALSLGWSDAGKPLEGGPKPKFFLGAGRREGVFRTETETFASNARSAGYNVRYELRDGVHGQALWTLIYPDIFEWAFPAQKA